MVQTLTLTQLQNLKTQIKNGGLSAAIQVYAQLNGLGYHYAGWAEGVAAGNALSGLGALIFLKNSAAEGAGGNAPRIVSDAEIDQIRLGMANGYLDALIKKADPKTGLVSEDVRFDETQKFHKEVFEQNGLSLDNWTLQLPMELYRNAFGDAAMEALWIKIRETSGDGLDGLRTNTTIVALMSGAAANSANAATRAQAQEWLAQLSPQYTYLAGKFAGRVLSEATFDVQNTLTEISRLFASSVTVAGPASPLILDLDGDGLVESTSQAGLTYFDHNRDGFAERTGWVGADDGLLVRDLNKNGQIDDGGELFGDNTLVNGKRAADGFAALKALDSNQDGVFSKADTAWAELKVWKDSNGNARVDSGELLSLDQAKVASINLNVRYNAYPEDAAGNMHYQQSSYVDTQGNSHGIDDVWFKVNRSDTQDKTPITIPSDIQSLLNLKGMSIAHAH